MVSSQKLVQGASALLAVANKAYKSVQDVVPPSPVAYVPQNLPRWQLAEYLKRSSDKGRSLESSPMGAEARTKKTCDYPLEVVILQDSTYSFNDDFPVMVKSELPEMVKGIKAVHPKSTFGVVSYTDKPIFPFGWADQYGAEDWCWKIEQKLSASPQDLINTYKKMRATGGGDEPQNQLGALFNTLYSKNIGWNSTKNARRLIVISTDAPPHYDGDGNSRQDMTPFSGKFDEKNAETQCVTEFYPNLLQVVRAVLDVSNGQVPPYVAFLIHDNDPKKKIVGAWKWFAAAIGESPLFVRDRTKNSNNFRELVSEIIYAMDGIECDLPTTTSTTTRSTSTSTTLVLSSSTTATTTKRTTSPIKSTTTFALSSSTSTTTSPISSTTTFALSSSTKHIRKTTIAPQKTTARRTTKATTKTTTAPHKTRTRTTTKATTKTTTAPHKTRTRTTTKATTRNTTAPRKTTTRRTTKAGNDKNHNSSA